MFGNWRYGEIIKKDVKRELELQNNYPYPYIKEYYVYEISLNGGTKTMKTNVNIALDEKVQVSRFLRKMRYKGTVYSLKKYS